MITAELGNGYREEQNISYYETGFPGSGNIEYRQERCKLDIYYPVRERHAITIIWFHGGGLQAGEKEIPPILKNRNLVIVAPNYRLSSALAQCPDYLEDAAAAVAWVFKNIAKYGGDPEKIYVSGGSGGGYLAAMMGMAKSYLARHGISTLQLAGVMPVSGQMTTHFQIVNERAGLYEMNAQPVPVIDQYAPMFHVSREIPPLTLFVGDPTIEWPGRPEENALLAALLKRIANHPEVEFYSLPGFNHGDIYEPSFLLMFKKIQERELKKAIANRPPCTPLEIRKTALAPGAKYPNQSQWQQAKWVELRSRTGEKFVPETRAAMLHDGKTLYFSSVCNEPATDKFVQKVFGHDAPGLWDGDCVELYLAPNPAEPAKAIQLVIAPDGSFCDLDLGLFGNKGLNWVANGLEVKTRVDAECWSVELALPLTVIGMTPNADGMSGNILRRRMADGDDSFANWSPTLVAQNFFPELFGKMTFDL